MGSIPGVLVGGSLAMKSGKNLLRGLLSAVLIASGVILIAKGDAQLAVLAAAVVSVIFGGLFTYVLRREVKLPHGEGVRAYKLISLPWARPAHAGGEQNGKPPAEGEAGAAEKADTDERDRQPKS